MNNKEATEEEDIFLDANASPELVGLRRSARKRKSITEDDVDSTTPKTTGKRHRPLGKMAGVHRSPVPPADPQKKQKPANSRTTVPPSRPSTSVTNGQDPRATLTVETDPPTPIPTAKQMVLLGGMRAVLKEELSATEQRLTGRITEVEGKFDNLRGDVRGLERRMDEMERKVNSVRDKDKSGGHVLDVSTMLSRSCPRQARYWKAKRSLRMWPIEGDGEEMRIELQRFLSQKLRLGEDVMADAGDCSLRRIPPANKNGIKHEVTVEFPTVDLRDVVRSAAYNLAGQPGAGIRLEIAHHLMPNFKALSSTSYKLKQKYPGCKRNMRKWILSWILK